MKRVNPWQGFHAAWTACVGTPAYDKGVWRAAEAQLLAAGVGPGWKGNQDGQSDYDEPTAAHRAIPTPPERGSS